MASLIDYSYTFVKRLYWQNQVNTKVVKSIKQGAIRLRCFNALVAYISKPKPQPKVPQG